MTYECNDLLAQLLTDLRANQKEFFKTRSQTALEKSKALERELDKYLAARNQQHTSPDLFTNSTQQK